MATTSNSLCLEYLASKNIFARCTIRNKRKTLYFCPNMSNFASTFALFVNIPFLDDVYITILISNITFKDHFGKTTYTIRDIVSKKCHPICSIIHTISQVCNVGGISVKHVMDRCEMHSEICSGRCEWFLT